MNTHRSFLKSGLRGAVALALVLGVLPAQERPRPPESAALRTPLPPAVLELLANEISGQLAFNNEVKLAGAPWTRGKRSSPKRSSKRRRSTTSSAATGSRRSGSTGSKARPRSSIPRSASSGC